MADNDVLRRDGVLVRITGFDDERTAYFGVMPNGHTTQLTFPRQEVFDVGDVLLVGTDFYRKVPHDVWPLKPRVGIVRRALNEGVVLETSDGLELLEGDYPNSIMPGNTVQFTDLFGIECCGPRPSAQANPITMTTSSSTASRRAAIRRLPSIRSAVMSR